MRKESEPIVIFPFHIDRGAEACSVQGTDGDTILIRGVRCVRKEFVFDVPVFCKTGPVTGRIVYWQPAILEHDIMAKGVELVKGGMGFPSGGGRETRCGTKTEPHKIFKRPRL